MPSKTLNDAFVKNHTTTLHQEEFFDAPTAGLSFRVTANGRKSWCFTFTPPGERSKKRARMTLGTYPQLGLGAARTAAEAARALVQAGKDPRAVEAKPTEKTIKELIEDRLSLKIDGKVRSAKEIRRIYEKHVTPVIGDVLVKDFRITHLNRIIDPLIKDGSPIAANRLFEHMRALMNFAVARGEIEYSRMAKAERPTKEEPERERWLTLPEVHRLWTTADAVLKGSDHVPNIIKLLLCLGQRLSEVAGMARSEIDQQKHLWTIPAERSKNGFAHVVPLNDLAWSIIADRLKKTNGEYLFPREDGEPVVHQVVDRCIKRAITPSAKHPKGRLNMDPWRPHDLRRTVATHMSLEENGLNIPDFNISQVLNHRSATSGSVTHRVYIQNTYITEKKLALGEWGRFLAKLVGEEIEEREAA